MQFLSSRRALHLDEAERDHLFHVAQEQLSPVASSGNTRVSLPTGSAFSRTGCVVAINEAARKNHDELFRHQVVRQPHPDAGSDEAHLQHLLTANCFGDHHTRTGLELPVRELLTFAMLVALGGCDPQVRGHVAGNLDVGNPRDVLLAVTLVLLSFIGYPRTLNAVAAINEIAPGPECCSAP